MEYNIHSNIKEKLLNFFWITKYNNKLFFFNNVNDNRGNRRANFIKEKFKYIFKECPEISIQRKESILNYFSIKRKTKILFDCNIFTNDIQFSDGFFKFNKSPFYIHKTKEQELNSFEKSNDEVENSSYPNENNAFTSQDMNNIDSSFSAQIKENNSNNKNIGFSINIVENLSNDYYYLRKMNKSTKTEDFLIIRELKILNSTQ